MDPVEKTDGKPEVIEPTPPKPNGENVNRRFSPNDRVGLLVSIAGLLVSLAVVPGWGGRVALEIIVGTSLLAVVVLRQHWLERRIRSAYPSALVIILGVILVHFAVSPLKEVPTAEVPGDRWVVWEQKLGKAVEKCDSSDFPCIALAVSSNNDYPRSSSTFAVDQLNADIRAGSILMSMEKVFNMLDKNIGVKRNFIGDGLALPLKTRYWESRVPEYLVRNLRDTEPALWAWELKLPTQGSKQLTEILQGAPIEEMKGRTNQREFLSQVAENVRSSAQIPAVIRFGRFARKGKYAGTLGRPTAKRVFVLRLSDIYYFTLDKAVTLSGYSLEEDPNNPESLWIWVYLPTDSNDLVPPTWGEIIPNIKDWLAK